jgi:hypothetical protein
VIVPGPGIFNASVPFPVPVDAVTVHNAPEPETAVTAGVPDNPDADSEKLPVATPVTGSLNVTVHCTLDALVELEPTRAMDETVGAVVSYPYGVPVENVAASGFPA